MSKILIDDTLFLDLVSYHLAGDRDNQLTDRIAAAITLKLEHLNNHAQYTMQVQKKNAAINGGAGDEGYRK